MNDENPREIERAGRRCGVCGSGRGWRRFETARPANGDPIVLCGNCKARFGDNPPHAPKPAVRSADASPLAIPALNARRQRHTDRRPDRLRTALRTMPESFSTATAARAAGLNHDKTLARLHDLQRRGEVHRVGNRWSTRPPVDDQLAAAFDRLQAQTSNVRIVRHRPRDR